MNLETYKSKYKPLKQDLESKQLEINSLSTGCKTLERILDTIDGLEKTQERYSKRRKQVWGGYDYDPGKYDKAYFYVFSANKDEVIVAKDFKYHQYLKCDKCKKEQPLIVSYEQTADSPEGDTWEANAFIICCDKIQPFQTYVEADRFLTIE